MMKKITILSALFVLIISNIQAQVNVRDSAAQGLIFNFAIGGFIPGGDVSELYGANLSLGIDVFYKTKNNWLLGVGANYTYGNVVKNQEQLLSNVLTESGNIIGINGDYAEIRLFQRGYNVMAKVGKIYPLIGPNPNSGLLFQLGVGYTEHSTLIENKSQTVPQILDEYGKGYDRLHSGLMLSEYIGFYHSGNRRAINYTIGLEFQQGFTTNQRGYDYSTRQYDTGNKLDLYYGLKVSWFLPIYDKNAQKFYYH